MRLLVIIILVLFIAAGIVVGALNADVVAYDLGFIRVALPKGAAVLAVLVVGWLLGGLTAWLGLASQKRRVSRQKNGKTDKTASSIS